MTSTGDSDYLVSFPTRKMGVESMWCSCCYVHIRWRAWKQFVRHCRKATPWYVTVIPLSFWHLWRVWMFRGDSWVLLEKSFHTHSLGVKNCLIFVNEGQLILWFNSVILCKSVIPVVKISVFFPQYWEFWPWNIFTFFEWYAVDQRFLNTRGTRITWKACWNRSLGPDPQSPVFLTQ